MTQPRSAGPLPVAVTRSNALLVWHYLSPLLLGLVSACIMAGLLGVVTALVGALVGPCLQIITAPKDTVLAFNDLLGPRLGAWAGELIGASGMAAGDLLGRLPALLVALAFMKGLLGLVQWYLWERAGEIASLHLRDDLFSGFVHLDPAVRREDAARAMEENLSSGITTDVKLLREYLVHFYGGLPREALQVVFLAVTLVMLSPKLTAIFLLGIAPAAAAGSRIGKKLRRRAAKALADYSQLTEWLQQRLLGIETIKHYRTEAIEGEKMELLTASLYERFLRAARVKARTSPLLEALAVVSMVVVLIIALRDISAGRTTGSVQLSFFSTLALLSQAAGTLGRYLNSNREGAAAVDRLRSLFSFFQPRYQPLVAAAPVEHAGASRIVCEQLTARYPAAVKPALADFTYTFTGGLIYCLAGPSGAGKSTLFNTLLGLVKPASGRVRFEASQPVDGAATCYMPQKVLLAPDTVAANVAYPDAAPDLARVAEALAKVGLADVVAKLGGLEAQVGEGGAGVSGGQAQRFLLARLWYQQKPFVLVDEGTSALDPEIEREVHDLLRELSRRGAVVVTIAHRQAAAAGADVLLLLEHGRLVAAGTPQDVMASAEFQQALR